MVLFATSLIQEDFHCVKAKLAGCTPFPLGYLDREDAQQCFTPSRIAGLVSRVCKAKDLEIPQAIKIVIFEDFGTYLIQQFQQLYVYTNDFIAMVREALVRLKLNISFAIDFFASRLPDLARYLAGKANLPTPNIPLDSLKLHFGDAICTEDHFRTARATLGAGEIFIDNDSTVNLLRRDLEFSEFITFIHHEPPLLMPHADLIDMVTIRTNSLIFHVFLKPSPFYFRATIELLKAFEQEQDGIIYSWSPAGLIKILSDRYGWFSQLYDIKPEMSEKFGKDNVPLSDISRSLFHAPLCWRARTFSAHIRPSLVATTHRSIVVTTIHRAAAEFVHAPYVKQMAAETTQEQIDTSGEGEERLQDEQMATFEIIPHNSTRSANDSKSMPQRLQASPATRFQHSRHTSASNTRNDSKRHSSHANPRSKPPPRHVSDAAATSDSKRRRL